MTAEATEVGFIFQCTLCGSYSIFAIDALDPWEVSLRASGIGSTQKTLQKDVHAAQEELLEAIQKRVRPAPSSNGSEATAVAAQPERFALLPCTVCFEIQENKLFAAWLDDRRSLDQPVLLCPHIAVRFEFGEAPPAYLNKAGKWCLAQGVGPKDLERKAPNSLPAGQFRALLPPAAPALRPPCWPKAEKSEGSQDPPAMWEDRRALIQNISQMATAVQPVAEVSKPRGTRAAERAPPVGQGLPWLQDFMQAAEEAWKERRPASKQRGAKGADNSGASYVRVPILSVPEAVHDLVEEAMLTLPLE
eukprot:TRINITY_DN35776_c0_g1_i1.p1 TRINITY_DN35776_c0_g1~~TRINITY_DN35776_c0_g1_i1.p1  ORF type:complete len:305 (+),score=67.94 TRINITY_DN35776_c0_g1_i1:72-986(+)